MSTTTGTLITSTRGPILYSIYRVEHLWILCEQCECILQHLETEYSCYKETSTTKRMQTKQCAERTRRTAATSGILFHWQQTKTAKL